MPPIRALLLLAVSVPAAATPADLGSGAERFAGAPVALDARLARRICPGEGFRFAWAGRSVEATCPASGERLLLALADSAEMARLRRGDSVQADFAGRGFRLSVGAVAESSPRDGRMMLRNSRSGLRFGARLDQSGRIIVSGPEDLR